MKRILAIFALSLCATLLSACADSMPRNNGPTGPTPDFAGLEIQEFDANGAQVVNGSQAVGDLAFGTVSMGSTVTRTFNIANNGNVDLSLTSLTIEGTNPGSFTVDTTNTALTVPPGTETQFTLSFSPQAQGALTAQLRVVHSSNSTASPFLANLSGTGQQPASRSVK